MPKVSEENNIPANNKGICKFMYRYKYIYNFLTC